MAKGIHQYSSDEGVSVRLGQAGFDVVAEHDTNTQSPDSGEWIKLQCLAAVTPGSTAYSAQFVQIVSAASNLGDDLGAVFMQPGDIIYGNFSGVVNHTNSNATLLAYRG